MPQESAISQEDDNLLGKLENGVLRYAPRRIIIDGETTFNPYEEKLRELGYKDVETTDPPAISTQTQKVIFRWEEQEDKIVQVWDIVPAQSDLTAALQEIQTQAVLAQIAESEDKTLGIACMALFPVYEQNRQHDAGTVETHPETGYPYECMTAYDGTVQQDWTIDNRTLWKPWHSRKKEYALPWEQPTGAHDMYKAGECMIWTDGTVKKCIQDTNFSPDDWPQAWEDAE